MYIKKVLIIAILVALFLPSSAHALGGARQATCSRPTSNAEAIEILNNSAQGYWWDHTHLTVAIQANRQAQPAQLAAINHAIATWSAVLDDCFDGLITLTSVTGLRNPRQSADIILHYVPKSGGMAFDGFSICSRKTCNNIKVRSDPPPSKNQSQYTPQYLGWVTLHELGHALGLGHATNLVNTTDLMGYGWPDLGNPVLSQCDVDALAFVFAWALEGSAPHRPAQGPYACSLP